MPKTGTKVLWNPELERQESFILTIEPDAYILATCEAPESNYQYKFSGSMTLEEFNARVEEINAQSPPVEPPIPPEIEAIVTQVRALMDQAETLLAQVSATPLVEVTQTIDLVTQMQTLLDQAKTLLEAGSDTPPV